jgi:hypothetical protein
MKTKTVVVPVEGDYFGKEFVVKTLSFGDECDMADELEANAIGVEVDENGKESPKYPKGLGALLLLEKGLKSGPVPITREFVHNLDRETASYLLGEINELSRPLAQTPSKESKRPTVQEMEPSEK